MPVVSEEITRLQGAKADIRTAIEAKGVIVPSTAKLDDYSGLIEQISGGTSPLPYTPLEYIETDGVAFIKSGVEASSTMSFDLKVKMNPTITASEFFVGVGNQDGNTKSLNGLWRSSSNKAKIGYGYYYIYSGILTPSSFADTMEISTRFSYSNGQCTMGVKVAGASTYIINNTNRSKKPNPSGELYIFATNVDGEAIGEMSSGSRLYYIKIISGSDFPNLIFDGVPCIYNGEYGLWDNVSNSFFGNANNSGAFTGQ